jgi:hypothetical protein
MPKARFCPRYDLRPPARGHQNAKRSIFTTQTATTSRPIMPTPATFLVRVQPLLVDTINILFSLLLIVHDHERVHTASDEVSRPETRNGPTAAQMTRKYSEV